ncbi:Gfo/Idh/MocA family protein [Chelativorans salis]|uniref:Gfo/Idh/MocA family oxidoreductase n=1 Tax=Chelativorans salis TaxID=2978478 RepID=A0ABT2LSB3_9HYPH|nr:Gfo/Idh/MocA family oxidoreductase [Chelativorans sp. EGI FJ00035]MCT7377422.1 Gfo/Idh/MocA family oxidoreductase [Chelativorans sp. EGI FJ00035]
MTDASAKSHRHTLAKPRLGFLGVGWIGRHRMQAIIESGMAEAVAIADQTPEIAATAAELAPDAEIAQSLDDILDTGVDGLVIATPSALHASQTIRALKRGAAVFCQKPLGRTAHEVGSVIDTARMVDRLLGVDMSYRFTEAARQVRDVVTSGGIGRVHAVEMTFHNAYGPDKAWFHDARLSGGGCVMDLGVHLVDLALWVLDFPRAHGVSSRLHARGAPLRDGSGTVEDYAVATIDLEGDTVVRLACSWNLSAGCDAVISAAFHGTEGSAALTNIDGSFYDFTAERYHGTAREVLARPPDAWGGRAAIDWAARLAESNRFNPSVERLADVAEILDRIYGRDG